MGMADAERQKGKIPYALPLAGAVAPHSVIFCQIPEKIPLLCTHYPGIIRKKD